MTSNTPEILSKEIIIDNEEKIDLIRSKKFKMARPFHWDEIKYIVEKDSIEILVRTPADEAFYMNSLKILKSKYTSINDYIKISVMGYSEVIDEQGKKKADKPKINTNNLTFESEDVYYIIKKK